MVVQQIGLTVLMLLMGMAFWNDISRHWSKVRRLAEKRHRPLAEKAGCSRSRARPTRRERGALARRRDVRRGGRRPRTLGAPRRCCPAIDALLRRAGVGARRDSTAFAIAIGPGSFTGLRIGVATLKGLAFGSQAPVAAVSTLAALARAAGAGPEPVVALLDARRGEVYGGAFRRGGGQADPRLPEGVCGAEQLAARLPARCRLVGEGAALVRGGACARRSGRGVTLAPAPGRARDRWPSSAPGLLARGAGIPAAALVPRYLRRAEAEVRRTGRALRSGCDADRAPTGHLLTAPIPLRNLG